MLPADSVAVIGFDPADEPRILVQPDGSVHVAFGFMPPSDAEDREAYFTARFQQQMEESIGVGTTWEDRELFAIPAPKPDTVSRLVRFLETYGKAHPDAFD